MKFLVTMMFSLSCLTQMIASAEVNVYSYRQSFLVEPLFAKFTELTGIKVNTIFASKGLIQKLQMEGRNSPADLLLTPNSTRLVEKSIKGMLPKNKLGAELFRNLYVVAGSEHPYDGQKPTDVNINELK